jgi:pimeloyl-ACP methyl ester carboxylesterase
VVLLAMAEELKNCCTCRRPLPLTEFNKRRAAKDGLQSRCRDCSRQWYARNRVAHKANVARRNARHRRSMHEKLATYLAEHPCVDCGETDLRCLEFDHRDRATKTANIARLLQNFSSWAVILAEIEKCDVRCANCHRRRTSSQFSTWRHHLHEDEGADLHDIALRRLQVIRPGWRSEMTFEWSMVPTPDRRDLEVMTSGPADAFPFVYITGSPTAIAEDPAMARWAAERGWRLVGYSRPGYGESTRQPGRTVADAATDVATILDALGHDRFVVLGWSGGGPHALACAALLPDRCAAAATLAGVAPFGAEGLDFTAGMGPETVEEVMLAVEHPEDLWETIQPQRAEVATLTGEQVADMLGGLIDEVDRASLTGEFAETIATNFRRAVINGMGGWHDDDIAFTRPWGFDLADVTVPVSVWQGAHDLMVPFAHGEWLAAAIPTAKAHLYPDEGHLSLAAQMPRILADLSERAGGV